MANTTDFTGLLKAFECLRGVGLLAYVENKVNKFLDYSEEDDPNMLDTVGSLADKLTNVTTKMFFNQELIYSVRKMTKEEFVKSWSNNMGELHEALKRCLDLNNQRARLIQAFDEKLIDIIKNGGNDDDVMRQHKTY